MILSSRRVCVLLPATCLSLAGCQPHPPETPQPPALVFIDGQIQESAATLALTQSRVAATLPAPLPVLARPLTAPTTSPVSSSVAPPQGAAAHPAVAPLSTLSNVVTWGHTATPFPLVYIDGAHNLTVEQWIKRIIPSDWQLRWQYAATSQRSTRVVSFRGNDEWPRVLNTLLAEQHLYGHIDTDHRQVTLSTSAQNPDAAAVTPTATAAAVSASAPVRAAKVAKSHSAQAQPGTNPFSAGRLAPSGTTTPIVTPPPPRWVAKKGDTLRTTLQAWSQQATCAAGDKWRVIWQAKVDYPIDAPMTFTGDWSRALTQVFTLYSKARTPVFATVYSRQCILTVTDQAR